MLCYVSSLFVVIISIIMIAVVIAIIVIIAVSIPFPTNIVAILCEAAGYRHYLKGQGT